MPTIITNLYYKSIGRNVVTKIVVYYKSFSVSYYLRKYRFLHFSRSSDMSGKNDDTLQKKLLFHI